MNSTIPKLLWHVIPSSTHLIQSPPPTHLKPISTATSAHIHRGSLTFPTTAADGANRQSGEHEREIRESRFSLPSPEKKAQPISYREESRSDSIKNLRLFIPAIKGWARWRIRKIPGAKRGAKPRRRQRRFL